MGVSGELSPLPWEGRERAVRGGLYFRFGFILFHSLIGGMMPRSMTS